jgi:ribonucleoside-diphosphate reductase alpha chain
MLHVQENPFESSSESESGNHVLESLRKTLEVTDDPNLRTAIATVMESSIYNNGASTKAIISSALMQSIAANDSYKGEPLLTENARIILEKRYLLKDSEGNLTETPTMMFQRVANAIAEIDRLYFEGLSVESEKPQVESLVKSTADAFYEMMARLEFLPNSPTMMNAGTGAGTLSACFVLPLKDSMEDIMATATDIAMVQKFGGGTGIPLSHLRPKGAPIATTHGKACGPIEVLRHLSSVSTMITQGGKRDGANMAVMNIHHPDIEEFITCKTEEGLIHNYNISVGATDAFMRAVQSDGELDIIDPITKNIIGKRSAQQLFSMIVEGAWRNGEPGVIFIDKVNSSHPTPHLGEITATNPCGEQPLLPYESCNLGSINLATMLNYNDSGAEIDWERLRKTVRLAVHFLDNVIDANAYSVPNIEHMTKLTRKIGLGVMGFADMLVRLGISYDSEEGIEAGRTIMKFISVEANLASTELAYTRGSFPAFKGSRLDYPEAPPMRNACRLTVAPTGTISMIAGCSSGVEPLFALAYRKQNILGGETLYYIDPSFESISMGSGFHSNELTAYLSEGNSLQDHSSVPAWVKEILPTAPDISPDWHVKMQAAFQESTDSAISKTINFPNSASQEDVKNAYILAWTLGCKGITVYRAGSREKEVLVTGTITSVKNDSMPLVPRIRPSTVQGVTERIRTGHGNMYVTINFDQYEKPFELFTVLGKAGSTDSAQLEAISRLVSMALRAGVDPQAVIDQLRGITDDPVWDSGVLIRSAPDALALALSRATGIASPNLVEAQQYELFNKESPTIIPSVLQSVTSKNDNSNSGFWTNCPECSGPLVSQEGCLMCRECGYNKCG